MGDQRTDVQKSTRAAAKYLKFLYQKFHDWNLVLAAYNWGPASVDMAIKKGLKGSKGEINLLLLPPETQAYLVSFYAFNRVIKDGWNSPILRKYPNKPYLTQINSSQLKQYLEQYPDVRPVNDWVLKYVNGFDIGVGKQTKSTMLVPTPVFSKYFLLNRVTFKTSEVHGLKKCDATNHSQYTAHYGDTLTSIAMRFKMRVDYLMDLNPLIKAVRPGMTINIC
jgi:membrane-bound lytic murein transglycosylase D